MLARLVFDRETGKPRGYGFCEFAGAIKSILFMREDMFSSDTEWTSSLKISSRPTANRCLVLACARSTGTQ
jgi:hypothetical protein